MMTNKSTPTLSRLVGLALMGALVYTAKLGGQVRHTEIRGAIVADSQTADKREEKDD